MDESFFQIVDQVMQGEHWYLEGCRNYIDTLQPAIDALTKGIREKPIGRHFIYRCMAKRAEQNLRFVLTIAETPHSFIGPGVLRPLCEDLIYGRWLATLPKLEADVFVGLSILDDLSKSLRAQSRFLPQAYRDYSNWSEEEMRENLKGWAGRTDDFIRGQTLLIDEQRKRTKAYLKALGIKLGWPKGKAPSIYSMAKQCGLEDTYEFFYHGTSKAVHTDLHHLLQMAHYTPDGLLDISNTKMAGHHKLFSLAYGLLLTDTIFGSIIEPEFTDECSLIEQEARGIWLAVVLVGLARQELLPPLVTRAEELLFVQNLGRP